MNSLQKNIIATLCKTLLALATLATPAAAAAQEPSRDEAPRYQATATDSNVRIEKGNVAVQMNIDLGEKNVRSQEKRIITPILRSHDGNHTETLPPIVVNGRKRALKDLRDGIQTTDTYTVLKGNRDENRYVAYRASLPYESWMDSASLALDEKVTGCNCKGSGNNLQNLQPSLLYAPQIQLSSWRECPVEYTPHSLQRDAYLIYPVDQTILYPTRYGNQSELAKIDSALLFVQRNPIYEIRTIEISGHASPEGKLAHNIELSQGRAEALKSHILKHYTMPDTLLVVKPGTENWDGLVEVLQTYELPHKQEILDIIAAEPNLDRREDRIKEIGEGVPYRTLLHAIYPYLRKNTFTISYISRERTPDEARQLVFTNPSELNIHEFYRVIDAYYADKPGIRAQVLCIAADTYPRHSIANSNAALACLQTGDLEMAERYLLNTQNEPATWNNRACLLWQQGKVEEAVLWWQKAAAEGDEQARHNLSELQKRGY